LYSLQKQYIKGGWKPIEVRGRTSKDQPFGVPKPIQIKPSDLEDWRPEVKLTPVYPKDDAQRYQLARLATEGDRPILSVKTAQENIVELPDTLLEGERIAKEWSDQLPIIRLWEAFKAALADGDVEKANNIVGELQRLMAQMMPNTGQGGGGGMAGLEGLSMENPGTGLPSGETGLSSDVMPSEALGGLPGGATNARGGI